MSAESVHPHLPENGGIGENDQREQEKTTENSVVSLLGRILPTKDSEILPLALCESVYPYEGDPMLGDNNSSEVVVPSTKKWYLQVGLSGVYAINNYLYERRKTWRNSKGETVMYLNCTKFRLLDCKNATAVLIITSDGTKKIRRCCEDHTHPPPFAEVVKRNVKLKLKALTERFPEKTTTDVYRQVVKEETLAYTEIDPIFIKFIPKFNTVRSFLHRERQRVREERGLPFRKMPKRTATIYETVEVHGPKRTSDCLPLITDAETNRLKEKKIKEEIISSSDENSCADDPMESEVTFSEGTSNVERGLDPPVLVTKPPAITSGATRCMPAADAVQQISQTNHTRFQSPMTDGVLQANNDSALPSIVAVCDSNSLPMASTNPALRDQLTFQSRFDHLAKNWSEKLKSLRNDQRIFAEKLINDVFFEGELCLLNPGCKIYNPSSSI